MMIMNSVLQIVPTEKGKNNIFGKFPEFVMKKIRNQQNYLQIQMQLAEAVEEVNFQTKITFASIVQMDFIKSWITFNLNNLI